jgi:hypothetical protein
MTKKGCGRTLTEKDQFTRGSQLQHLEAFGQEGEDAEQWQLEVKEEEERIAANAARCQDDLR